MLLLCIEMNLEEGVKKDEFEEKSYGTFANEISGEDVGEAWPPVRVSYDDVLEQIGEFGRWQQWQTLLYSIPPFVSGALFMLGTFTSKRLKEIIAKMPQINSTI